MASKLDIPLHGSSVHIVKRCGLALSDILNSKFGCVATIWDVDFDGESSTAQQRRAPVVQEKRFDVTLPAGVRLSVWKADLTQLKVDAVVNAANKSLQHYGGLALALSTAGGPLIQSDSDDHISAYGPLNTGDAIISDARSLPCKKIIHAVGPQLMNASEYVQAQPLLEKAIRSILDRVKENSLQTVAIPAISSGLFNYPLPQCANTIVSAVKQYYEKSSPHKNLPTEVQLVNNDKPSPFP